MVKNSAPFPPKVLLKARRRIWPVAGVSNQVFFGLQPPGWGSAANSMFRVFVTLLRDGVHLILANPPWRQLQERAQKIQGDKKHIAAMLSQSRCAAQFRTAHNLRVPAPGAQVALFYLGVFTFRDRRSWFLLSIF